MLRLTAGEFKGRTLKAPGGEQTRPTQAKLRQALFNSVQFEIPDAHVLDLFAGSGALALEALSRGARSAVLVENARAALKAIEDNVRSLAVSDRVRIEARSVDAWLKSSIEAPFDLIFADPPYAEGWETRLLDEVDWSRALRAEGHFCLEWGLVKSQVQSLPDETPFLVKVREKNYGDSVLTTYSRKG